MKDKKVTNRIVTMLVIMALLFTSGISGYADVPEEKDTQGGTEAVQEHDKTSIDNFTVVLGSYLVMADGSEITPEIVSVSGQIDGSDDGVQENIVLTPDEYEVRYYRVYSFSKAVYEETETISEVGEYKVTVVAKDTEKYTGEAYVLFSVAGKPQKLAIAVTKYTLSAGSEGPLLEPETDGDGSGFSFVSSDPSVVSVSDSGQTGILKPGRAVVTVSTEGTIVSQPAKIQVVFEIKPETMCWNSKAFKKQNSQVTLMWKKQSGVTSYQVVYATNKSFTKQKKTKTVRGNLAKTTLKSLKKGKTYYVKVRALAEATDTRGYKRTIAGLWSPVQKIAV